eukprot:COSAG02_NODE_52689_length_306_cov_0.869565_1_plen_44_part_10
MLVDAIVKHAESERELFGYVMADQSSVTRTKIFLITSREDVHAG